MRRSRSLQALRRAGLLLFMAVVSAQATAAGSVTPEEVKNGAYNSLGRQMQDQQKTVTQQKTEEFRTTTQPSARGGRQDGVNNVGGVLKSTQTQVVLCGKDRTFNFNGAYLYPNACSGGLSFQWCDKGLYGGRCYTCASGTSNCTRTGFVPFSLSNGGSTTTGEWTIQIAGCNGSSCSVSVTQQSNQVYANEADLKAKGEARDSQNYSSGSMHATVTRGANDPSHNAGSAMTSAVNCNAGKVQNYVATGYVTNCANAQSYYFQLPGTCESSCSGFANSTTANEKVCEANDPSTTYTCTKQSPMCSGEWPEHKESCTQHLEMETKQCRVTPPPRSVFVPYTCPSGYTYNSTTRQCVSNTTPPTSIAPTVGPTPTGYTCTQSSTTSTGVYYSCARPNVNNCTAADTAGWTYDHRETVAGSDGYPQYYVDAYYRNEKWVVDSCPQVMTPPAGTYCYGAKPGEIDYDDQGNPIPAEGSGNGCFEGGTGKKYGEATYYRTCWVKGRNYVCYKQSEALSAETCSISSYRNNPAPSAIKTFECISEISPGSTDPADPPEQTLPPAKTGYGSNCPQWEVVFHGTETETCSPGYATASGVCSEVPYACTAKTETGTCTQETKTKECRSGAKVYCNTEPGCTFVSEECSEYASPPPVGGPVACKTQTQTYACSTSTSTCAETQQVCSFGTYSDPQGNNMEQALAGSQQAQSVIDGMKESMAQNGTDSFDPNTMRLFDGKFRTCDDRIGSSFATNDCCQKNLAAENKPIGASCSASEVELAKSRTDDAANLLTKTCTSKMPFGGCIIERQYYCAYASLFGRIVNDQGKKQLAAMAGGTGAAPSRLTITHSQYGSEGWRTYSVGAAQVALYQWSTMCRPSTSATAYNPSTTNCAGIDNIAVASCVGGNCGALPARPGIGQSQSSKWHVSSYVASSQQSGTVAISSQNLTMKATESTTPDNYSVTFIYTPASSGGMRRVGSNLSWPIYDANGSWAPDTFIIGKKEFQPYSIALTADLGSTIPVRMRDVGGSSWTTISLPTAMTTEQFVMQSSPSVYATGGCDTRTNMCDYNITSYNTVTARQEVTITKKCKRTWYGKKKCKTIITTDCSGFTLDEFAMLDFSQMDLSEFTQSVEKKLDAGTHTDDLRANAQAAVASAGSGSSGAINQTPVRPDHTIFMINPDNGQKPLKVTVQLAAQIPDNTTSGKYIKPKSVEIDWGDGSSLTTGTVSPTSVASHKYQHTYSGDGDKEYQPLVSVKYENDAVLSAKARIYMKASGKTTNASRYGGAQGSTGTYKGCDQSVSDRSSGATDTCTSTPPPPTGKVDGVCGSGNGVSSYAIPTGTAACGKGTQQISDSTATDGQFNWMCLGSDGGVNVSCAAPKPTLVDGQCGPGNGVTTTSIPSGSNACARGVFAASDSNAADGAYNWSCLGAGGGVTAACSAPTPVAVNGICGAQHTKSVSAMPSGTGACEAGNFETIDGSGSDGTYDWRCAGTGTGSTTAICVATRLIPENGVCGTATGTSQSSIPPAATACTKGLYEPVDSGAADGTFDWTCVGKDGGTSISCSAPKAGYVAGQCGTAQGVGTSTMPGGSEACFAGTLSVTDGTGTDGAFNWNCTGAGGGPTASCSAPKTPAVNGACGSANGTSVPSMPAHDAACTKGEQYVQDDGSDGSFNWQCIGEHGGSTASCMATNSTASVNGVCGSRNGTPTSAVPTGAEACSVGTRVVTDGAAADGEFDWSCQGSGSGTTAHCSAPLIVNGSCGSANGVPTTTMPNSAAACSKGSLNATDPDGADGAYNWSCTGSGGGSSATCTAPKRINGICGTAQGSDAASLPAGTAACSAGTQAVTDSGGTDGTYNWNCTGSGGGSTAACYANQRAPIPGECGSGNGVGTTTIPSGTAACSIGSQTVIDGSGVDGVFNWSCSGLNGAGATLCSAPNHTPVHGQCGTANGTGVPSVPAGGAACSIGAQSVTDSAGDDGSFDWNCMGDYGGSNATCSATRTTPINGTCGAADDVVTTTMPSGTAACSAGSLTATDSGGNDGEFNWNCLGANGGTSQSCSAPKLANGICGSGNGVGTPSIPSGESACSSGVRSVVDGGGSDGAFDWTCVGTSGGTNQSCSAPKVVTGSCGAANGQVTPTLPSGSAACSSGTQNSTDATAADGFFDWQCVGFGGGGTASCSAPKNPPVNGQCGADSGVPTVNPPPSGSGTCSRGTTDFTDSSGVDGTFNWNCVGLYGGTSQSCSAPKVYPVNGVCGSGNGVGTPTVPSGTSACSSGNQTVSDPSGDDGSFNWTCVGLYGGSNQYCAAPKVISGSCGSGNGVMTPSVPAGTAACNTGTQLVTDGSGADGAFNWSCMGFGGGATASCSAPKTPPVNGQCGSGNGVTTGAVPSGAAACSAGSQTVTDGSATDGSFNWTCVGLYGGSSASCAAPKGVPPDGTFNGRRTVTVLWYTDRLEWSFPNATSCTASGAWVGNRNVTGTMTLTASLGVTKTYTLTCTNAYGSVTRSVTLVPP